MIEFKQFISAGNELFYLSILLFKKDYLEKDNKHKTSIESSEYLPFLFKMPNHIPIFKISH